MLVKDIDLPEGLKEQQRLAHKVAEQAFEEIWNYSCKSLHRKKPQIDGNSALSYFSTILTHFAARWIIEIDRIAQKDDAGVERGEIIKNVLNGIVDSIGGVAVFEDEEKPLPDGIKRLKK